MAAVGKQANVGLENEIVPALILVLACELVEAQNLARACMLLPA